MHIPKDKNREGFDWMDLSKDNICMIIILII